jgi:hypothetical protein
MMADACQVETVMLPVEMIAVIENDQPEVDWMGIKVHKVLQYIADMLEE